MARTDSHQLRQVAADSPAAQAVKVVARAHKTLIWERTRHVKRLRHQLRDYFPAALDAFEDLDAPDTLELLAKAPDPAAAARLTTAQVSAVLKRARRRNITERAAVIRAAFRITAADPATAGHRRVRFCGPGTDRCPDGAEYADHDHGGSGGCPFSRAPGR